MNYYIENNIDITKLTRDYLSNPLLKHIVNTPTGYEYEKPHKNDVYYLYITCNLNRDKLSKYFNISPRTLDNILKAYNIKKTPELQQKNRIKNSLVKYGYEYPWQSNDIKLKLRESLLEKYDVDNIAKLESIKLKEHKTKLLNGSYGKSSDEDVIYNTLLKRFKNVLRQYVSKEYPFACDFYIQDIDTYIEYQGYWSHGNEPYNNTPEQQDIVKLWESKNTDHYKNAINVWINKDPLKRKTAKDNKLKWFEFFTMDDFMKWFIQQ